MERTPNIRKHVNGVWGIYLGEHFIAGFDTEVDAEIRLRLLQFAEHDNYQRGYNAGLERAAQELARQADKLRDEVPAEVMGVAWDVIPGWYAAIRALRGATGEQGNG